MTDNAHYLTTLTEALDSTLVASQAFQPLLEAEKTALSQGDLSALNQLIADKKSLTENLLSSSQRLLHWCAEHQLEPKFDAFESWSQCLTEQTRISLQGKWLQLRANLNANHQATAVNRQLLTSLSERNQAQLSLLHNLLGMGETYSANGQRPLNSLNSWVDSV